MPASVITNRDQIAMLNLTNVQNHLQPVQVIWWFPKEIKKLSFQLLSDATEPPVGFTNPLASSVTGSDTGSLPAEPPAYQDEVPGEGSNYQKFWFWFWWICEILQFLLFCVMYHLHFGKVWIFYILMIHIKHTSWLLILLVHICPQYEVFS